MKTPLKRTLLAVIVVGSLLASGTAQAANGTWIPTGNATVNWWDTSRWSGGTVANGQGATAYLNVNITGNIAIYQNITPFTATLGTLNIGDTSGTSTFSLNGGTVGGTPGFTFDVSSGSAAINKTGTGIDTIAAVLTLNDNLVINSSSSAAAYLNVSGAIGESGSHGVTVSSGWVDLGNAASTYTGGTTVNSGAFVTVTVANGLGSTSGSLTVDGSLFSKGVNLTVGSLNGASSGLLRNGFIANTVTLTIGSGNASGGIYAGALGTASTSLLAVTKTGTGTQTLSGNNTYTGVTTLNDGLLIVSGGNGIGDLSNVTINNSAQLQLNSNEAVNALAGSATSGVNLQGNTLTMGWQIGNETTVYAGAISGATGGSLIRRGAGTTTLTGANTFTGSVTVMDGGTLSVPTVANTGSDQPLGTGASPITFNGDNATLKITGNGSTTRGLQLGASNFNSRLEVDAVVAPTVTLSGSITGGSSGGAFTKAGNGIFNFSGSGNWNGALKVTGGQFNVTSFGSINGPNNEGIGGVELTNGSIFNINTSTQVKASSITITSGAVNLNAGTLRTNSITGASAFTWGAGTLTVQNAASGSSGSTDRSGTNGSGGAASGPVIYEGTVLDVNNGAVPLATSSGSILDLGGLYTSGVLRYDQLKVTGALNLTAGNDTLNIAISPYRLRPSGPNDVATGDWGTLRLVLADSFAMNGLDAYKFDQVTGITSDMIGWTSAGTGTNTNTNPFNLAINTYFIEYRTSGVQSGAAILFHYKVAGSVPEPASAGLIIAGALMLRALRRRK